MLALVLIFCIVIYFSFFFKDQSQLEKDKEPAIRKAPQMKQLWSLAQGAIRERKLLKAEKALLTILKFDEKNATAYNRLGILYAKEKQYKEAVECFEIAQSLDNNASSLHNVGLIYLETEQYEKAAMAFDQAIKLEGDMPARYIAYAKAQKKLGFPKKSIEALETAYSLDNSTATLRHILEIYEEEEDEENILVTKARIEDLLAEKRTLNASVKEKTKPKTPRKSIPKKTNKI